MAREDVIFIIPCLGRAGYHATSFIAAQMNQSNAIRCCQSASVEVNVAGMEWEEGPSFYYEAEAHEIHKVSNDLKRDQSVAWRDTKYEQMLEHTQAHTRPPPCPVARRTHNDERPFVHFIFIILLANRRAFKMHFIDLCFGGECE